MLTDDAPRPRRPAWRRLLGAVWMVLVVVALAAALASRWRDVAQSLGGLRALPAAGAVAAGVAGVGLSQRIWHEVMVGLGAPLAARSGLRVFFLAQLGKYLPGSLWPVVAQAEMANDLGIPRRTSVAAQVLFLEVHLVTGAGVAAALLPAAGVAPPWLALGVPVAAALLVPRPLVAVLDAALRLARRQPLPVRPGGGAMARAAAWAVAMWAAYGASTRLLVDALCPVPDGCAVGAALPVAAFAAAWAAGFVVLVAPAGAGAREAVLVALLGGRLDVGVALAVALVSRLVLTAADGAWAALAAALPHRSPRAPARSPRG